MIRWDRFETPFGGTFVAASSKGLLRVTWSEDDREAFVEELRESFPLWGTERNGELLDAAESQLLEYFAGERRSFDLPVDFTGLTPFQSRVLDATAEIPFGETLSYGELARRIDKPNASRAVGTALGKNPVPLIVPCHRVIRSDGSVGGYTAGTGYKEQLLELEARG